MAQEMPTQNEIYQAAQQIDQKQRLGQLKIPGLVLIMQ